jgi:hypothetical protein
MALPGIADQNQDAILRKTYASQMKSMLYQGNKRFLLGSVKKTIGGGESFTIPIEFGGQPGRSATFSVALANRAVSKKVKFNLDWTENFVQAIVNNSMVSLSKGVGAVVNLKLNEIKAATTTLANAVEHSLIRSGFNEIGAIASVAGSAPGVYTMVNRSDTNIVDIGQVLVAANAINSASLNGVAQVVTAVDRDAGTITTSSVTTSIVAGNVLFQQGDQLGSATPLLCVGIGGWLPILAPAGVDVGGVDRSQAPQALAGVRMDGRGKSAKEAIFDLVTRVADAGGEPDVILCTNDFVGKLVKEIEGSTVYAKTMAKDSEGDVADIFYEAVVLHGPTGQLKVQGHPYMYADRIFALTMDSWEMKIAPEGTAKDPIFNGTYCSTNSPMIDDPSTDSQIARLKALFLFGCNAPQHNGVSQIA